MDSSRTKLIVGERGLKKLSEATVAVFGIGGVGGYALEAIARAGVGRIILIDFDRVMPSNINRQILSLNSSMGETKTDVAIKRLKDINPEATLIVHDKRLNSENMSSIVTEKIDYAIDAIDEIEPKIHLILRMLELDIKFISSMGAGNRLDPSKIHVADISKTSYCPLARSVRKKLKEHRVSNGVKCVYSSESPVKDNATDNPDNTVGSISYLPGIFGLTAAGEIIREIVGDGK